MTLEPDITMPQDPPWALLKGGWKPLDDDEAVRFIVLLNRVTKQTGGDVALTRPGAVHDLRARRLAFYPGWLLVEGEVSLESGEIATFDVLYGPRVMFVIDGTSDFIHRTNAGQHRFAATASSLRLDADTAADYLRFFCGAVWGGSGPFRVVEDADAIEMRAVREHRDAGAWRAAVAPLSLRADGDAFVGDGVVHYGNGIFKASFRIAPDGMVQMVDDTPLAADVPESRHRSPLRDLRDPRVAEDSPSSTGHST